MKEICKILNITYEDYEMVLMGYFIKWCQDNSRTYKHLQLLIGSNSLFVWYNREYNKKNKEFLDSIKNHVGDIPTSELQDFYASTVNGIKYFPQSILITILSKSKEKETYLTKNKNLLLTKLN